MNHYPTQLDEIDQWLFDTFGIVAGACSSTENLRYNTAKMVAEALWPSKNHIADDSKKVSAAEEIIYDAIASVCKTDNPLAFCQNNETVFNVAKAVAKRQREQDHYACRQCEKDYDNVFYKGVQHAIEMMREEAIERTVKEDAGGYPYIDETELYDYDKGEPTAKKGDKVKVYIFKN